MIDRLGYSTKLGLHIRNVDELYEEAIRFGRKANAAPPHSSDRARYAKKAVKAVKLAQQAKREEGHA